MPNFSTLIYQQNKTKQNKTKQSVHVMIKHDKDACKRKGQDVNGYTPRTSLAQIEKLIAARKEMESNSPQPTIEIQEEEKDDDVLAALNKDCEQ